ncbi:Orotidine 5'-phosphate decarboxylase [Candidatus Syntrophocurvum alkaliphilum]|uniref:Orotidine 5'-phosphate decarboxylase n=1 Tax=Candidatus Syntrophocurvum alkaliphilum TaxID=2293317 RepID=A0A6I6DIE9_9FIRM|nr:orotidine-5'-phosphate decarboxylase [Candidatus Syntrophocurvum alkaliphilum]QGT99664.1 Orotidine 5'-phosphate decarboxylase [Candidatus Syntrophocurvum alkaliphilum]
MQSKDRIVLALDVDTKNEALELVGKLSDHVGVFKVGMQLFNTTGPDIVKEINDLGGKVFVDLKFHDIPNTVGSAARVLTRLNSYMFNIHAAGGKKMMEQAAKDTLNEAEKLGKNSPLLLAVTVLTSISQKELEEEMFISDLKIPELVEKWALMAKQSGVTGVVCSPQEIEIIRKACGSDFVIVTPGIRPSWSEQNDQKRITTPRQALELGADYMVIGRPITEAKDPVEAAQSIIEELEA